MGKVFVTGYGIISSLGHNAKENHNQLVTEKSGIGKAQHFVSNYVDKLPFAEINLSDSELKKQLAIRDKTVTRTTLIALKAFQEAISHAQLSHEKISSFDTAFISASTVGGMCYTDALHNDANRNATTSNFVSSYEGSKHTLEIARRYKMTGITDTINTACSSSANAILLGKKLIQSGRVKRAIVGGSDCLAKYTVNGFNALQILSQNPCKPFDKDRDGLTLGEGAAYLVLENENCCKNKTNYAEITGAGNANDANHPSATSDDAEGPLKAMHEALQDANLTAEKIDYINAHGTGTPNNDQTESFAFSKLFSNVPPYSSTKSYTGHTLAAAGAIEAIFSIFALQGNELFPNLAISKPIEEYDFSPIVNYSKKKEISNVMSNSFGFSGNCTSLILSKCT